MEKVFEAIGEYMQSEEAQEIDMVQLVEVFMDALRSTHTTIEDWQFVRMIVNNCGMVFNHLIDEEIAKLQNADHI